MSVSVLGICLRLTALYASLLILTQVPFDYSYVREELLGLRFSLSPSTSRSVSIVKKPQWAPCTCQWIACGGKTLFVSCQQKCPKFNATYINKFYSSFACINQNVAIYAEIDEAMLQRMISKLAPNHEASVKPECYRSRLTRRHLFHII